MTEIGKMIRDEALKEGMEDGIKEGIKQGAQKGKYEIVIKLLIKKFKKLPQEYIDKIKSLSDESLEVIATDIFDIESVDDLKRYF